MTDTKWTPPESLWADLLALRCNVLKTSWEETGEHTLEYLLATPKRKAADELYEALEQVQSLIAESQGVSGFHLNGDIADWGEFDLLNVIDIAMEKARGETE